MIQSFVGLVVSSVEGIKPAHLGITKSPKIQPEWSQNETREQTMKFHTKKRWYEYVNQLNWGMTLKVEGCCVLLFDRMVARGSEWDLH